MDDSPTHLTQKSPEKDHACSNLSVANIHNQVNTAWGLVGVDVTPKFAEQQNAERPLALIASGLSQWRRRESNPRPVDS